MKPDQCSPNPSATKRVKGKQPEVDQAKLIEELRKVSMGSSVHSQCVPNMREFNALVDLYMFMIMSWVPTCPNQEALYTIIEYTLNLLSSSR